MLPLYINLKRLCRCSITGKRPGLLIMVLFLLAINFSPYRAQAQPNITRVEYYIDNDPGFGNATALAIVPGTNLVDQTISIDPATVSEGVHRLYARALDANGHWSLTNTWLFYKPYNGGGSPPLPSPPSNIKRLEYYIDIDPGFGNGTAIGIGAGTDLADVILPLDPTPLAEGVHRLYVRALNNNGNWSLTNTWLFYKPYSGGVAPPLPAPPSNITRLEYYVDNDPGFGNASSIPITPGTDLSDVVLPLDPTPLADGVHRLYVRARNANGNWSMTNTLLFYKPYTLTSVPPLPPKANLSQLEYYIDIDPGFGNGKQVAIPATTDISDMVVAVSMNGLTAGSHKLYFRSKDANGKWSLTNRWDFTIPPSFDQTLSITGTVPPTLCLNSTFNVSYTATGTYNATLNQFKIQLSDASGSFASPVVIGSITSNTSGTIPVTIPGNTPGGSGYRIRVISTDPALVSVDNGSNLTIGQTAVINCPPNITVNADPGLCTAVVNYQATGDGTITYSIPPGSTFPVGTTTVTATTSNDCGSSNCSFTVTVVDNQNPVANCKNATVTLDQSGNATLTPSQVNAGSTDNCGIATVTVFPNTFNSSNIGPNNVTLTVTDVNGNVSTCTAVVTVNPAPVFITYYRDADGDGYGNPNDHIDSENPPPGYVTNSNDCDDTNANIHPGAPELCNGVDDNCNGLIDEGVKPTWYQDADGDGYGNPNVSTQACAQPQGYVSNAGDCNDTNANIHPGAQEVCNGVDDNCNGQIDEGVTTTFYRDLDGDGYGNPQVTIQACSAPQGYVADNTDCNDNEPTIHPNAPEVCNGIDDDCDGVIDEGVKSTFYRDFDQDGYGDPNNSVQACSAPPGYVADNTDCNDQNANIHPNATEVCNGIDDDCDGLIDEGVKLTFYQDADGDGFGNPNAPVLACSAPQGYVSNNGDCNDNNAEIHPGATEVCNGLDDDCDGQVDEGVTTTFYQDADGDGYGNPNITTQACVPPNGYVANNTDCDDQNANVHPGAQEICNNNIDDNCDGQVDENCGRWYLDFDGDGYGNPQIFIDATVQPPGYVANNLDCNDQDANIHPGATEVCNGVDDDCDGLIDEGVKSTFYQDADGDGFGNPQVSVQACSAPQGYVADNTDCDDTNASVHPGATEICNGIDDDCDGLIDEGVQSTFYQDADGDGYGNPQVSTLACSAPQGYVADNTDCDDTNANVHPGATEICNGIDDDCDGLIDENVKSTFYQDADGDGYGNPQMSILACSAPQGYVADNTDCNDQNPGVHPGATEICNGIDDDCDGLIDENVQSTFYRDFDGDGYGDASQPILACSAPNGYVSNNTDCNDQNAAIHPGATELCDGIDNDCDGQVDENCGPIVTWYRDFDQDGYGDPTITIQSIDQPPGYVANNLDCDDNNANVHPGATEVCNGIDDDCDGQVDEGVTTTFYQDADGDGYGNPQVSVQACSAPQGYVSDKTDCNDQNPNVHPNATEVCNGIDDDCDGLIDENVKTVFYRDSDGDGYGDMNNTTEACTAPPGYVSDNTDCNDQNQDIHPGAQEVCNGLDDNCDGQVDEGVQTIFYRDADGDGYGDPHNSTMACSAPNGYVSNGQDCNDTNVNIHPGATEVCNGIDDNCDGIVDENCGNRRWYWDYDHDGYGDVMISVEAATPPPGYVADAGDCNDYNPNIHPNAPELCNGIDDDCDGVIDDGLPQHTFYWDYDHDGYGDVMITIQACAPPPGYVEKGGDCNDYNPDIHPNAVELCNGIDDDCDGIIDDGVTMKTFYWDYDHDGYGDVMISIQACAPPPGFVPVAGDCNDYNPNIHPGAPELCNGIDDNCNGVIDEGLPQHTFYWDYDHDGYGDIMISVQACAAPPGYVPVAGDCDDWNSNIHPGAAEIPGNNRDDNCNGLVDEVTTKAEPVVKGVKEEKVMPTLDVKAYPNPSTHFFTLAIKGRTQDKVLLRIIDEMGRVVEERPGLPSNTILNVGHNYRPGIYYAEVIQSGKKTSLKMIKLSD